MKTNRIFIYNVLIIVCALVISFKAQPVSAAGTSPQPAVKKDSGQATATKSQGLYQKGLAAVEAEDYDKAYDYFKRAHRQDSDNPDILNMLAFSQRKRGNLVEAFQYYDSALKLRTRFPQAREYLGEAHIQAALEQIRILQGYGAEASHELEDLVEAFREAAEKLPQ